MKISRDTDNKQTQNAVSVGATNGFSVSPWYDCTGYDQLAVSFANDASTASLGDVQWSMDGITQHGIDFNVIPSNTSRYKSGITPTKAKYFRVVLSNTDPAAHIMSVWAYLKS